MNKRNLLTSLYFVIATTVIIFIGPIFQRFLGKLQVWLKIYDEYCAPSQSYWEQVLDGILPCIIYFIIGSILLKLKLEKIIFTCLIVLILLIVIIFYNIQIC